MFTTDRYTDFTIDAHSKWRSLFNECLSQLGCPDNIGDPDALCDVAPEVAWKSVYEYVLKAAGSLSTMSRSSSAHIDIEFIRNSEYKDKMQLAHNLKGLKEFLSQVCTIFSLLYNKAEMMTLSLIWLIQSVRLNFFYCLSYTDLKIIALLMFLELP